jgi:hypothetical protein
MIGELPSERSRLATLAGPPGVDERPRSLADLSAVPGNVPGPARRVKISN